METASGKDKQTILIAGDIIIAQKTAGIMEKNGFHALTAGTGYEASEIIRTVGDICMILLDIGLSPAKDGLHPVESAAQERDIPILLLYSRAESEMPGDAGRFIPYGLVAKNSGETELLSAIRTAIRLHKAHAETRKRCGELEASFGKFQNKNTEMEHFFNASLDLLCIADTDGYFRRLNPEWEKSLGYPVADLEGRSFLDFVHPDDMESTLAAVAELAAQKKVLNFTNRYRAKDGSYRWIEWRAFPAGKLIYAAAHDITQHVRMENDLRESEEKFRFLAEKMADIVWTLDLNLKTTYVSPSIEKVLGFSPEERKRQEVGEIMTPDSLARVMELFSNELEREKENGIDPERLIIIEVEYYHKNGSTLWMENTVKPLHDITGALTGVYGLSRDITERRRAEATLKAALEEKSALLRELQHRVKNSLTMIASLVNLETERADDPAVQHVLGDLRGRINTLSNLYSMIFSGGDTREIRLDRYLQEIARSLMDAYARELNRIELRLSMDEITIDAKKASSFGLILNELVTNALKYAFPVGRPGAIEVCLAHNQEGTELEVRDTGPGLPAGFDLEKTRGLGLVLVRMLAKQLGGEVKYVRDGSTRFIVKTGTD